MLTWVIFIWYQNRLSLLFMPQAFFIQRNERLVSWPESWIHVFTNDTKVSESLPPWGQRSYSSLNVILQMTLIEKHTQVFIKRNAGNRWLQDNDVTLFWPFFRLLQGHISFGTFRSITPQSDLGDYYSKIYYWVPVIRLNGCRRLTWMRGSDSVYGITLNSKPENNQY